MTTIAILLYDGFDELDAVGPFEVFQNAARAGADLTTRLVTHEPRETVTASHGLRVGVDDVLAEPDTVDAPDVLVVPGGGWSSGEDRGVRREYDAGVLPAAIAAHHDAGALVASVCTGAMLLAKAGLTNGRPAVTHHSALDDLRESGADVRDARVVDSVGHSPTGREGRSPSGNRAEPGDNRTQSGDDGDLVTAGGVTSGIDLALYLVEREFGTDVADEVATVLEYERSEDVHVG